MTSGRPENPKQKGCSTLIDAVPQTGECPFDCGKEFGATCYGKGDRFYASKDKPMVPTKEEAVGKIVRVNSYHDSNYQRELVLKTVEEAGWEHFFFNTKFPNFDFPVAADYRQDRWRQAPVVYTCNTDGWHPDKEPFPLPPNLMYVRIRTRTWDLCGLDILVEHYINQSVPVVLTFLRFDHRDAMPGAVAADYELKEHVLHSYWTARTEAKLRVLSRYKGTGVRMCGTPWSSLCVDCLNCDLLYWQCLRRVAAFPRQRTR